MHLSYIVKGNTECPQSQCALRDDFQLYLLPGADWTYCGQTDRYVFVLGRGVNLWCLVSFSIY